MGGGGDGGSVRSLLTPLLTSSRSPASEDLRCRSRKDALG